MRIRNIGASLLFAAVLAGGTLAPTAANAQFWHWRAYQHHRQQQRNEWRDIAIGAGALGVIGALEHDDTLFFAGTAGALYSTYLFWRKRVMGNRVIGNILIAAGALSIASASTLTRLGLGEFLYVGELVAAIIMFAGFIAASRRTNDALEREPAPAVTQAAASS